jgi:hypothetical protein
MYADLLTLAYKNALELSNAVFLQGDPVEKARLSNAAVRAMQYFQQGYLMWKKQQNGGEQRITVKHVNVEGGGQAVIGNVKTGGEGKK